MNNQEKQEFIKSKIIEALFACLKSKQLDEMTADEIAEKADVSKRTLYKYYSSKKEMYLALVKESFMDLSNKITTELKMLKHDDPWYQITCIGREYMGYCLNNPIKAKLIHNYDEMNYTRDYEKWVRDIQEYSNRFELVPFIKKYYEYHNITPPARIESIALYLWAEAQGMASLIIAKRNWIRAFYGVDEKQLIEEHLELSKRILGERE